MQQGDNQGKTGQKSPELGSNALVAVGSSVSFDQINPAETVRRAIQQAADALGVIRACSRFYRTPAFPAGSGPDFVNAAFRVETKLHPAEVLAVLHDVESRFGRERKARWAPRTLDLDLIGMDDLVLPDAATYQGWVDLPLDLQMRSAPDALVLPHPRMHERGFVLIPLADVAPDWCHPVRCQTVTQMAQALSAEQREEVRLLE
jgi:2-amino-4-hydroxy-6-hydroxymethyldihydropteridine diphosphokinase